MPLWARGRLWAVMCYNVRLWMMVENHMFVPDRRATQLCGSCERRDAGGYARAALSPARDRVLVVGWLVVVLLGIGSWSREAVVSSSYKKRPHRHRHGYGFQVMYFQLM